MDCMHEWGDRVNEAQLQRVLELGEALQRLGPDQKPMRMTLIATKLAGEGVARSLEEAYVMLCEACLHHEVSTIIQGYEHLLEEEIKKVRALRAEVMRLYRQTLKKKEIEA